MASQEDQRQREAAERLERERLGEPGTADGSVGMMPMDSNHEGADGGVPAPGVPAAGVAAPGQDVP